MKKVGSLAERYPDIAQEWHPTKNVLTPFDVAGGSSRKVWWRCSRGHEWQAIVYARTRGGGCPVCHPQTSRLEIRLYCELKGLFNNLTWRENIGDDECDLFIPDYRIGIELDGYPWHQGFEERDRFKTKRLHDKGITIVRVRDDRLTKLSDDNLSYRDGEPHLRIVKRVVTRLERFHFPHQNHVKLVNYLENNRLQNTKEYRRIVAHLPGPIPENSLERLHPHLAKEWHSEQNAPLKPHMFSPGSEVKVWWICDRGHQWEARIVQRTSGRGCPYCAGKKASDDYNLAALYPEIAKLWHPTKNRYLKPTAVTPSSNKKVWWQCERGHDWMASMNHRTQGKGCPYCAGKKVCADNNLAVINPALAKQWHPTKNELTPYDVTPGSGLKVWWRCNKGQDHEWKTSIACRSLGTGCPFCSGKKVGKDNNLGVLFPELAKQWHPTKNGKLTPFDVTPSSSRKVWWTCDYGHEWKTTVAHRKEGTNCPECYRRKSSQPRIYNR